MTTSETIEALRKMLQKLINSSGTAWEEVQALRAAIDVLEKKEVEELKR